MVVWMVLCKIKKNHAKFQSFTPPKEGEYNIKCTLGWLGNVHSLDKNTHLGL